MKLEGLNTLNANVMLADDKFNIVYMNPSVVRFLQEAEAEIRKELPDFDASALVGRNIDVFHKNPSHQRRMLTGLSKPHRATIRIGARMFDLNLAPVSDDKGKRMGFVVEWADAAHRIQNMEFAAQIAAINKAQGVAVYGLDGKLAEVNGVMCNAFGCSSDMLVGRKIEDLTSGDAQTAMTLRRLWERLAAGEFQSLRLRRHAPGGRQVWTDSFFTPIPDAMGKPAKIVEVAADVTRQEDLLANLKRIIDDNFVEIDEALRHTADQSGRASSAAGETQASVQSVAAAAEELAAAAREIADSMSRSRQATEAAYSEAQNADQSAQRLTDVAKAMGGIVDLIRSIAGQINLLALNATIEAARAGDAGKGFAVVANEVKNLANQSANATAQISKEIEGMQSVSGEVVSSLAAIRRAMEGVREFVTVSAGAVEEQSAVTRDMSSNMQGASVSVAAAAGGIGEIQTSVSRVAQAVARTKDAAAVLAR
ncbi:MAG TPA: methyl-accepting chemotaxis protein [Azospirillaceae bacterium]|nr:methyl-accepting chemotaxis protein [Azospirillaceae bacterium]